MENTVENKIELTRVQAQHRIELRQALRGQETRQAKRSKYWSGILDRDVSLKVVGESGSTSNYAGGQSYLKEFPDLVMITYAELEAHQDKTELEIQELNDKLRFFRKSNTRALADLKSKQMKQLKAKEEESQKFLMYVYLLISLGIWSGGMMPRQRT
jgi:hypothetical protein